MILAYYVGMQITINTITEEEAMRTNGNFQTVFDQAESYYNGENGKPMNAVVRKFDGFGGHKWHIESGLEPEPTATVECGLDDFQNYFYEVFGQNYTVTDEDETHFSEMYAVEETDEE